MSLKTEKASPSVASFPPPLLATFLLSSSRVSTPYPIALVDARRVSPPTPSPTCSPSVPMRRFVPPDPPASRSGAARLASDRSAFVSWHAAGEFRCKSLRSTTFCDVLRPVHSRRKKQRPFLLSLSFLSFFFLFFFFRSTWLKVFSFATHILRSFKISFVANRYAKHATSAAHCTQFINSFAHASLCVSLLLEFRGESFCSVYVPFRDDLVPRRFLFSNILI